MEAAARLHPGSVDVLCGLGLLLERAENFEAAVARYREALGVDRGCKAAHFNLAGALSRLGRTDEAKRSYTAALSIDPMCVRAHTHLAFSYGPPIRHMQTRMRRVPRRYKWAHVNLGMELEKAVRCRAACPPACLRVHAFGPVSARTLWHARV